MTDERSDITDLLLATAAAALLGAVSWIVKRMLKT
jgi:hypothetical protein